MLGVWGTGAAFILLRDLRVLVRVVGVLALGMISLLLAGLALPPVDWSAALAGLTGPSLPEGGVIRVLALVGTTVALHALFLYPSAANEYWRDVDDRNVTW